MADSFDVISRGLLPFLGGMRRFIPFLFESAREVVPMDRWSEYTYHDMTCGSCAGSAAFGFYGMSMTANDLALRSVIPARAIFGRRTFDKRILVQLIAQALDESTDPGTLPAYGATPAGELVTEHLHPLATRVFDALYYAVERDDADPEQRDWLKYMAVRWVLLNKNYMYFLKLPTTDLKVLAIQSDPWRKVAEMLQDPAPALLKVAKDVDHLIHALGSAGHEVEPVVQHGDCRQSVKNLDFSRPSFVGLNPPTAGNSTFMQSNRVLDTLLHNEPQEIDDGDMPGDLWKSLVLDTARHVPEGHHVFSFVGDGAVSWEDGQEVFAKVGPTVREWSFPWHDSDTRRAGLVLLRREGEVPA